MAVRAAIADGNFLTAGTWGLVDATSYLNSETGTETLTTAFSGTVSQTFTPGAITIDGIGIKVSNRTGTTGTLSVHLELATVEVTGTLVTINMADLPAIVTADVNGGWSFFEFAAPVLLLAATSYSVAAQTSTASMCNVYRDGTADNMSRFLRTTTTGAPAAADDLIIVGEYTGAGASNTRSVTMDALASAITDYGAASNSQVTPSLAIGQGGSLVFGTAAATNYYLRQSGIVIVYINGTFNMGTVATPCPRGSTHELNFDAGAADGDFGLVVRNGGTFTMQGLSRTSGKDVFTCKLNTDEAVNSTSLGVDTDTGWLDNDQVAVASTSRTATESEIGALNGNAGASSLTVDGFGGAGGGLAFAHSGTTPTQAEVVNLTRSVKLSGGSSTRNAWILLRVASTVDIDWAEFSFLGTGSANKQGIDVFTTASGSFNLQFSAFHDMAAYACQTNGTTWAGTFSNNVGYSGSGVSLIGTTGTWAASGNVWVRGNVGAGGFFAVQALNGTFTNNTSAGNTGTGSGINFSGTPASPGTFTGNVSHSHAGPCFTIGGIFGVTQILPTYSAGAPIVLGLTGWRGTGPGLTFSGSAVNVTFASLTLFGNTTDNIFVNGGATVAVLSLSKVLFTSPVLSGDTTFATTNGLRINGASFCQVRIEDGDFGTVTGIKTAHTNDLNVSVAAFVDLTLLNTKLASATELTGQATLMRGSRIGAQKHDQTAALHKSFVREGTIAIETGTVHTGSQAFSMTPNSSATSTTKMESPSFFAAVANAATVTPTVYIQKSAAYDGNQPRLLVKKNVAAGISADTVLATYSAGTGSWNAISGATAAVSDDAVLEFVVDCDFGTGGVIYVDSFSVA
jgi:hypothetical protein